jgi:DNA-binding NarL/FixJ family response regulator
MRDDQPFGSEEGLPFALTARQWQVAHCLTDGLTYFEIAAKLGISVHTVNRHVQSVFEKAGTRSARRLAALIRDKRTS